MSAASATFSISVVTNRQGCLSTLMQWFQEDFQLKSCLRKLLIERLPRPCLGGASSRCIRCHLQSSLVHCDPCTASVLGGVGGRSVCKGGEGGGHPSGVTGRGHRDPSLPGLVQSLLTVSTQNADHGTQMKTFFPFDVGIKLLCLFVVVCWDQINSRNTNQLSWAIT